MQRNLIVLGLLLAFNMTLRADLGNPSGMTLTVKAGEKAISADDIAFTQKLGYVHLMFNATPYPYVMGHSKTNLEKTVSALIKSEGLKQFPEAKVFKVDVADISARDDYGLPAWSKIKLIERLIVTVNKKSLKVQHVKKNS